MARVKYTPDKRGLRDLGQSAAVQAVALAGAAVVAARARADDPQGGYEVQPSVVRVGWDNESRGGASVVETRRGAGARRRTLARAAEGD